MNRFDSAYSSGQRRVGLWLRALLLVMITTAGLLSSSSVHAQTTLTTTYSVSPVCAGSSTTVTGNLTPAAGVNIGYGVNAPAYAFANQFANVVALDDDQVSGQLLAPAGVIFPFHGENIDLSVNGFYIGSNGFITFRNAPLETQIAPRNLGGAPGNGQTYNAIYLCNTDLSPQLGGGVVSWEYVAGVGGVDNILYVTFDNVPFFLPGGAPGAANAARIRVQAKLFCNGSTGQLPGRVEIHIDYINNNAAAINAAQNQTSIGLLSNCQPPVATAGLNQIAVPGAGYDDVTYGWDPAAPALAGTQVDFFQCPTPGVNCNGVGGSNVATVFGAGPYTYVYAPPASTSNGTYFFYTRATMNNCVTLTSATAQLNVTATPSNPASISGNQNVCQGGSVTYTATRTVTGSTFSWGTTAPGASIVTGGTGSDQATITFPGGGSQGGTSYNITLQETNPAAPSCASANVTFANRVTVYTVPSGSISVGTATQCANATTTVSSTLTAPTGNTYNWSIPTNPTGASLSSTTIQNPTITFPIAAVVQPTAAQTTTVQVIVANGPSNLCSATFSANLVINPVPDTNTVVSNPTATCPNQNVNYTITAGASGTISGSNTYTYSASGLAYTWQGGYINGTSTAATTRQLQWTTAAGGTGTVTVVETTPSGCTRTYSTTTTVHPLPAPSIVGSNTPCQFLASATGNPSFQTAPTPLNYTYGLASGNAANGYRWVVTGGNIVAANAATTTPLPSTATNTGGTAVGGNFNTGVTQVTVQWTVTGAQSISCVENTVNGCQATTTMAVTVTASPVAANFGITGPGITSTDPCAGTGGHNYTTIGGGGSHTVTVSGGTISAVDASWSLASGVASGVGAVANAFTVTWGSGATGTISDEYTVGGCASIETYTISIQPLPSFTITPPTGTLCGGGSFTFTVSGLVNGGAPSYVWTFNDPSTIVASTTGGAVGDNFITLNTNNLAGALSATCVVTNTTTGCVSTSVTSATVNVVATPSAPTAPAPGNSCASDANGTRTQSYAFTGTAGGTLSWSVSGAPAGTTTSGSVTLNNPFTVTWGQIARVATAAPTSQNVTVTATQTVAGCTSPSSNVVTTLYAMPADAPVATTGGAPTITSLCAGTTLPVGLTVTTNGNAGQPTINYTWSASGVTLSAAGPALTNTITNLGGAGAKTITVTATDPASSCATVTTTSFTVAPVPTPVISGNTSVCQEINDPVGQSHGAAWTHTYNYQTTLVPGNSYGWQITEGYIVAYSTNNGGSWITPAGNVAAVGSQTLAATVDASRVRVVFYGTTPGKVKVTETFPGGAGCGATTPDYNVNFNPRPTVQTLTASVANVCEGANGSVTLGASQANWSYQLQRSPNGTTWSNALAAPQNGTGAALTFNVAASELTLATVAPAPTTWQFRVVATSNGASLVTGCGPYVASAVDVISVHHIPPTPSLSVNAGSSLTCFGTTINFTAGTTVSWANYQLERSPAGTGTWAPVGGAVAGGAGTTAISDATSPTGGAPTLATPNYDYRIRATSTATPPNCQSGFSGTASTTVFALPTNPTVTISPNPVCFEENFTVTLTNTQEGVIYEVRNGGVSLTPPVTILGNNGSRVLTINSAYLTPTITANPSGSSPFTVDVSAALTNDGGWTRPIPVGACLQAYGSTVVTVLEKPVASISSNATACGGSSTVFTPGNVTPAPNQFFNWVITTTPPAGTTPTFANRTVNNTVNPFTVTWGDYAVSCNPVAGSPETQTQTVRLIAENANGCLDTTTRTITLYPTPYDAFIQGDATACVYGGYEEHIKTYSVKRTLGASCTFPTGTSYAWSMSTGTVSGTIRSGQGTSEIIGEWNTTGGSGTGTVTCVITLPASWGACAATKSMNVTVYPLPTPAIVGPTDVCQNNAGSPTSTSNYTSTLYTGDTYKWDVVGGTITTPGGATGAGTVASPSTVTALNGNNITVTWGSTPTNSATVTLTETTPAGCVARNTITVNVRATPTPVISGPTTMCDNAVATFSTANNAPNNTYNWTIAGNGTITAGANTASATVLAGTLAGGNFTITVTETVTATTCSKTVSQVVSLVATPVPTITRVTAGGTVGGACVNQTITYGNSDATTGTFGYLWTVSGNGAISGANNAATVAVNWTTTGTGTVTLSKWHSATQCTTTVAQNVTVVNPPAPAITGATNVCGNSTQTYSTTNNAGSTYSWTIGNATILSGSGTNALTVKWNNPAAGTTNSTTITVVETNTASGCSNSASAVVTTRYQPIAQTIAGLTQACTYDAVNNAANYTYSVANNTGSAYNWTIAGGTIQSGQATNSVAVRWTNVGTQSISVTESDASALCSVTSTLNVAVTAQPVPVISGDLTVCATNTSSYSTPVAAGSTYSWTVSGTAADRTIVSGSNANAVTVQWLAAGTRTLTVTETAGLCSATATATVTVNATPTQTAINGLATVCNGSTQNYNVTNVGGQNYTWTVTGGTIVSGAGTSAINVQWTTVGTQTVAVTITTAGTSCSTSLTRNVAVEDQPAPAITGTSPVCTGSTTSYSTPAVAGHTYQWTLSGGGTAVSGSTSNSFDVAWSTAGTHTVTVTQRNASANCQATATMNVVVNQTPTQTAIAGAAVVCNGSTQNYNVTSVAGQTYTWTVTGGTIIGGAGTNAIAVQWTTLGNQTVNVTIGTTGTNCSTSLTRNVSVEEQPNPYVAGQTVVCTGQTVEYSTDDNFQHSYIWTVNGGGTIVSNPASSTINVEWTTAGSWTLSVTQTNASGNCSRTATATVVVGQTPTQTAIAGPAVVCNGSTQNYNVTSVAGQTYTWTVTGGTITGGAGTNAIAVQWTTLGNQTVNVTIGTTGTNCSTSLTRNVTVEEQPAPSITGASPVCTGSTQTYSTAAVAGHTYQWSHTGGGTAASGSTSNSYAVNWTTAGTYTVSVTQKNASGNCSATANMTVVVNQTPTQTAIAGPAVVCNGSTQNYNVTSVAGQTYTWTVTGGTITGGAGTNAIAVQWTTLGNQTVNVTIGTTGTNCSTSLTRNVTVEEQPAPSISGPSTVCTSENASYATNAVAGHTYQWSVSGGATVTSGTTSNVMSLTWTTAGTHTVSVTQNNASGNCTATATLSVLVRQTPTTTTVTRVTPGGNVNQACQGQQITYSTPANAASSFLWTVNGGTVIGSATSNQVVVNWQTVGNGSITVTETTAGTNCSTTRSENVAVGYQPTPTIDGSRVVCIDKTHDYSTLLVAGSTYNWSITPANAFQAVAGYPAASAITVRWIQPGLHTMTVTETALGGFCVGVQTINVRVNPIPTPAITSTTGYGAPATRRPGVVCNGSTHTYTVDPTADNVFQWAVTGGRILSGQNTNTITVQWDAAGTGTIACTETVPGSDCITTDVDQIDIRRTPTPQITGEVNPCGNATFDYTTPLVAGNTYTWSAIGGTGVQTAPNTFRVTWTAPVWPNTTAASVTVREDVADVAPAGSCFATTTLNVTIRPIPPVPTITGPTVVCATNLNTTPATVNTASYTSSIPTITGASGTLTPTWSVTGGTIISGQGTLTANVQWNNNGLTPVTGTISVLHTSSFGCAATGTLSVTVNPLPTPSIVGATSACQNTVENYSTVGIPGNTYVWSLTGGNIIRSGQGTPNIAVEWTLPGVATLTVSETNSFGCTVLNQRQVTVNALPQATLEVSGPTTFCQGGDVTISAPIGFTNYVWNTGETARSIVVRTTGNYWCVVTDANGCSNRSDTVKVNVFPSALPIVTISGPLTFCEGGSVTLTAPAGFDAYLWSNGETTQSITVTESGSYTVSVSDNNGCTGTSTEVDVTVYDAPTPTLAVVGGPFCAGDSASVSAPAGYVSYTWVSQNGLTYGTTRNIVVTASDVIYCQVVDINGCTGVSDTVNLVFTRVETPTVAVNGPTTFCEGGAVTLTAPEGYASYVWSNGTVGRTITVDQAGEYYVTVATQTCPAVSAKTSVTVNNLPAIPTIQRMGDVLTANSTVATAYQWIRNGVDMPNASQQQLTVNLPGSYRVRITDANGCVNTSDAFDVILTDVNDDVVAGFQAPIRISPNPTNGRFTIETTVNEAGPVRIELVNALGELVMTLNEASVAGNFRAAVDMGTLSAGAYNVVVTAGSQRWVARMVRQ